MKQTADEILQKHEDANEMHFHQVDRQWIIQAMEEYAAVKSEIPINLEISDEEIEKEAKQTYREHPNNPKEHHNWTYGKDVNFARKQKAFIKGAKWYREQLKK